MSMGDQDFLNAPAIHLDIGNTQSYGMFPIYEYQTIPDREVLVEPRLFENLLEQ